MIGHEKVVGIPKRTIYEWIWAWNKDRYEGLKDKLPSPGRPPKLGEEEMERISQGKAFWNNKRSKGSDKGKFWSRILRGSSKKDNKR